MLAHVLHSVVLGVRREGVARLAGISIVEVSRRAVVGTRKGRSYCPDMSLTSALDDRGSLVSKFMAAELPDSVPGCEMRLAAPVPLPMSARSSSSPSTAAGPSSSSPRPLLPASSMSPPLNHSPGRPSATATGHQVSPDRSEPTQSSSHRPPTTRSAAWRAPRHALA
jgi:hypothetical protein